MQNLLVDNPNKTGYNLYANNVTVYENMTVSEDLVVAGDMSAERFLPTVNANQDFLTRVISNNANITYTGSIIPSGSAQQDAHFTRVGRMVTCELDAFAIGSGGTDSILTVDLSAFPDYDDNFKPNNDVLAVVAVRDSSGNGVANTNLGLIHLEKANDTMYIYSGVPGGNFTAPTGANTAGWQYSITFSYTANTST